MIGKKLTIFLCFVFLILHLFIKVLADLKDMLGDFSASWGTISFVVLCWFLLFFDEKERLSYTILKSFAFTTLQFYIIDLLLSLFSALRSAAIANLILSTLILSLSLKNFPKVFEIIRQKIIYSCYTIVKGYTSVFLFLVFIFYLYLGVISYYLPIRGTDDIGYRLPVVFENFKKSGILIPSEICDPRFAFPQFPYSIYKLYIIITGGERLLDFTNTYYLLILMLSVYYISIFLGARSDIAFFMSFLLLPITPIIIGQATSNYVDLAFASFSVGAVAIGLKLLTYHRKSFCDAVACGTFFGGLLGTKYTGLFLLPLIETIIIMSKSFRIYFVFNVTAFATGGFWYILNFINFGFPIYPIPGSYLGRLIYPNPPEFFSPPVRHLLAFLKYDNIDLSYHKGFGLSFWFLTLPLTLKFVASKIKNKTFSFLLILTFVLLLYTLWRISLSIHVNARFLIWALALTFPAATYEISKSRKLFYFSILVFLSVFITNIPKMMKTHHPDLDARVLLKKDKCDLRGYDKSFLRYNVWIKQFSEISSFIQFISRDFERPINIKCTNDDMKEVDCPYLFYGEIRKGKINEISSCVNDVSSPDLIIVIQPVHSEEQKYADISGKHSFSLPDFQNVYSSSVSTVRGEMINYEIFINEDLLEKLKEKIDFWKINCSDLFK